MRTIRIIKSEHQNLGAVLYSLEKLLDEIDDQKQPDFKVFHGLMTYIDRFLDRFHHPKENKFLFPRLLARLPESETLIRALVQQHTDGEVLFNQMLKALSAYEFLGNTEYPAFHEAVHRYITFEREHAMLEEREILPRAEKALTTRDWAEIDAAFGEHEDPMFGVEWKNQFSTLFGQLVNRLPAPYGLGEVWKNSPK